MDGTRKYQMFKLLLLVLVAIGVSKGDEHYMVVTFFFFGLTTNGDICKLRFILFFFSELILQHN